MNIFDYFGNAVCFYDSHFILVQVRKIQALVAAKPMCAILRVTCVMHELQNDFKAGVKAFADELKGLDGKLNFFHTKRFKEPKAF